MKTFYIFYKNYVITFLNNLLTIILKAPVNLSLSQAKTLLSFLFFSFWLESMLRPFYRLVKVGMWTGVGEMQRKLSQQELEKWAVTAWAIWTARNKFYFQHYQTHPKVIADMACGLLEKYQRLMDTHGQN